MQSSQGNPVGGVRATTLASQLGPASLSTMPSAGVTASQQQLLLAQRAAQGQGAVTSPPRPMQSALPTQQNQQHSSMQSGQTGAQALHQQITPSGIMGSASNRQLYGAQYSHHNQQQQHMGGLARPGMGGQALGHPSMLSVQGSQQYSGLMPQFSSQQMQARPKPGQLQASQFSASAPAGPQMGSVSAMGGQLVRSSGSAQQQQRAQQTQTRPLQQQQHQQSLQQQQQAQQAPHLQQSLIPSQKLPAQQLQRVSSGITSISLPNQPQQPWMQKQMHQQLTASATYQVLQQQAAQPKQAQTQHSRQPQLQPQQTHLSQQTQHQLHQLGRVQPSAIQRPPTPTGSQPGTPASGTPTPYVGALSQSADSGNHILGKRSIQELVAQVDSNERLEPEVEDILMDIADDFIESVTTFACKLAKHRKSNTLETKDVLLHLRRNWDLNVPGFGGEELHAYKRTSKKIISAQPSEQESAAGKASREQSSNDSAGSLAPMTAEAH